MAHDLIKLTRRQAQALAAARAGRSPKLMIRPGSKAWRLPRAVGGSTTRMVNELQRLGLLRVYQITAAGHDALTAYEAVHGEIEGPL